MNRFSINIGLRVILLAISIAGAIWLYMHNMQPLSFLLTPLILLQLYGIYYYLNRINRKLTLFLESIRYEDFSIRFSADNKLGKSFSMLNHQFNEVLEAFRQTRAEKEANLKYIDTIVQHISIGVLSFDTEGKIELINPAAFRLMGIYRLRNIHELKTVHPGLAELLMELPSGNKTLYATRQEQQLSIHAATVRLQGRLVKLISIQNIHSELQKKELEAWQNLTKILRHEIMNSVTPIVSLIGTMQEIVDLDIAPGSQHQEGISDLREALQTVESRSKGIMNFVNAYRDYTTLPQPQFTSVNVKTLITSVGSLFQADMKQAGIQFNVEIDAENLELHADVSQLQMVLINLVKNAMDALEHTSNGSINLKLYQNTIQQICIEITDNGPGIDEDAMNKIFIPFFTTKKKGSGIGLSLSQQIIQMHGGQLKAISPGANGNGTTFYILLNT
ncbi:GHKL domain-containing protein [Chitinophaga polysaccharea]|uniref:sensor histidine kinase n=1 Tax=Chitinophaga TaxID=79328 RepID=UPI001455CBA9|nr:MULTISPECIES: ATP-binding protein [Chitinophaga]NLR60056.1 GHKL domain-containing protein [Chitinophaga polysaccharea]NLU94285.1 GHKL domain-containing protein [Chitinophaga sp. Ak27]